VGAAEVVVLNKNLIGSRSTKFTEEFCDYPAHRFAASSFGLCIYDVRFSDRFEGLAERQQMDQHRTV
jgi:hypothetical protein